MSVDSKNKGEAIPDNLRLKFEADEKNKISEIQAITGIKNLTDIFRLCLTFTYENYPKSIKIKEE